MIQGIDHLVIISDELDLAISNAREAGFTVVPGGTHKDGATHNALIAFADGTYIELIAPTEGIAGKNHRWFPRLAKGGGLVDLCLQSSDLAADTAAIVARGREYVGPEDNGRSRLDGVVLQWRGSFAPGAVGESGWPFLIEDVTPRENRVPHDVLETTHANGAIGVAGVTILVNDLEAATADFEAITGQRAQVMTSPLDDSPLAAVITFDHNWLMLTHPSAGDAKQFLQTFGAGPHAVSLKTHDGPITPGTGRAIAPELLSGALFELV